MSVDEARAKVYRVMRDRDIRFPKALAPEIGVSAHALTSFMQCYSQPKADFFLAVCEWLGYKLTPTKGIGGQNG